MKVDNYDEQKIAEIVYDYLRANDLEVMGDTLREPGMTDEEFEVITDEEMGESRHNHSINIALKITEELNKI